MKRLRPCLEAGCPELVTGGRCVTHGRERDRRIVRVGAAVYRSRRWRGLRRQVLKEQPWCAIVDCLNVTREVDHIVPVREGMDPYDRTNLQGLCHACHSRKTSREVWHRT